MLGGNIYENDNDIYSHILGIGFEFETNFISKLSLNDDKTILVNSNISPRLLYDKIFNQTASIFDEHYLLISYYDNYYKNEDDDNVGLCVEGDEYLKYLPFLYFYYLILFFLH
jgi:hypothetical protein